MKMIGFTNITLQGGSKAFIIKNALLRTDKRDQ